MPIKEITIRKRVTIEQKQGQAQPQPQQPSQEPEQPAQPQQPQQPSQQPPQQPEKPEQPKQPPQEPQQKPPSQPQPKKQQPQPPQRPSPNPQQQRPGQPQKARPPQRPQSPQEQQRERAWGQQLAANRQRARRMPTLAPDARLLQQPQRAQGGGMGAEDEGAGVQDQAEEQARQAQLQQALPAMLQQAQAMQAEQALSNPQMRAQAASMIKEYQMRMQLLREDIRKERRVYVAKIFNNTQTAWRGTSDAVDVINLGTFWTIANWIQSIVMPFIMIWRAWQFAKIAYSSAKRQAARRARVVKKAIWRFIITTLITLIENVPIINIIPIWSIAHWIQRYLERLEALKLSKLLRRIRYTDRVVQRMLVRARRSVQQRYAAALLAKGAITNLENEFDKL